MVRGVLAALEPTAAGGVAFFGEAARFVVDLGGFGLGGLLENERVRSQGSKSHFQNLVRQLVETVSKAYLLARPFPLAAAPLRGATNSSSLSSS